MTKKNLIKITAAKSGLTYAESKELMDATFSVLMGSLSLKRGVTIPHFGTFDVHMRWGRRFFNIVRSTIMMSPLKYSVLFHPSKEYKEKIRQKLQS